MAFFIINFSCCPICAKTVGEVCGGPGDFSGRCEPPLKCVAKLPTANALGACMGKYRKFSLIS